MPSIGPEALPLRTCAARKRRVRSLRMHKWHLLLPRWLADVEFSIYASASAQLYVFKKRPIVEATEGSVDLQPCSTSRPPMDQLFDIVAAEGSVKLQSIPGHLRPHIAFWTETEVMVIDHGRLRWAQQFSTLTTDPSK